MSWLTLKSMDVVSSQQNVYNGMYILCDHLFSVLTQHVKVKVTSICIVRLREHLKQAQIWITQCYLQTTRYLH